MTDKIVMFCAVVFFSCLSLTASMLGGGIFTLATILLAGCAGMMVYGMIMATPKG